ncbi:MFS-type transporter SLC18B1 [Nymphon striatum]|nr:MFS-type transporter SLC18B1 [Nymphon striatum]
MSIQERRILRVNSEEGPEEALPVIAEDERNDRLSKQNILFLITILFNNLVSSISFTIVVSFLTQTSLSKGASSTETGFIFSAFALSFLVCSPFVGLIVPIIGLKFTFLSSTFILAGSSFVVDAPSRTSFVALSIAIRIVAGTGNLGVKAGSYTTFSSISQKYSATLLGLNTASLGIGNSIGPFIGGVLYDIGGFKLPFFVLGGVMTVTGLTMYVLLPDNFKIEDTSYLEGTTSRLSFLEYYSVPVFYIPVLAAFTMCLDSSYLDLSVAAHVTKEFGASKSLAGSLFIGSQVVYVVFSVVAGALCDRLHLDKEIVVFGFASQILAFLLIGPAPFFNIKGYSCHICDYVSNIEVINYCHVWLLSFSECNSEYIDSLLCIGLYGSQHHLKSSYRLQGILSQLKYYFFHFLMYFGLAINLSQTLQNPSRNSVCSKTQVFSRIGSATVMLCKLQNRKKNHPDNVQTKSKLSGLFLMGLGFGSSSAESFMRETFMKHTKSRGGAGTSGAGVSGILTSYGAYQRWAKTTHQRTRQDESINLKELMSYPLMPVPSSIGTPDGYLPKTDKSKGFHYLTKGIENAEILDPSITMYIEDGNATFYNLKQNFTGPSIGGYTLDKLGYEWSAVLFAGFNGFTDNIAALYCSEMDKLPFHYNIR